MFVVAFTAATMVVELIRRTVFGGMALVILHRGSREPASLRPTSGEADARQRDFCEFLALIAQSSRDIHCHHRSRH
jgi:hypothetical protein